MKVEMDRLRLERLLSQVPQPPPLLLYRRDQRNNRVMFFRMTTDTGKVERKKKQAAVAGFMLTNSTRDLKQVGTFFRDDTRRHNLTCHHSPGVCKIADEPATAKAGTESKIKNAVSNGELKTQLKTGG